MQNQSCLTPSGAKISCDGYMYTLPLKTLAVGSAVNCPLIIGFCAVAAIAQASSGMLSIRFILTTNIVKYFYIYIC